MIRSTINFIVFWLRLACLYGHIVSLTLSKRSEEQENMTTRYASFLDSATQRQDKVSHSHLG